MNATNKVRAADPRPNQNQDQSALLPAPTPGNQQVDATNREGQDE